MSTFSQKSRFQTFALDSISFLLTVLCLHLGYREVFAHLSKQNGPNVSTFRETLDPSINLSLQWTVNKDDNSIIFSVEANTRQIIIGLTNRGQVNGSDLIVCGVDGSGAPYVFDMYGTNNNSLAMDERRDWRLLSGSASINHIQIQIQRKFDTCDEQDRAISGEAVDVVWDWENRNERSAPTQINPKGQRIIYFLDPFILPISSKFNPESQARISRRITIPPKHTTYWCSIHKLNATLRKPHHIYGFSPYFGNEDARRHVHHQLLYRCYPPAPGVDPTATFEPFVNHPGEECYLNPSPTLPSAWCRESIHIFAIGGEPVQLPDTVGLMIGETRTQYFMLETHYSNPELRSDLLIESGADIQYSSRRRKNDGSIIFAGSGILGTFVVPPRTSEFSIVAHCSKDCLAKIVPAQGAQILGVSLHAHMSARKMRVRHFRGTESWIITDEDYRFDYQQIRFLQNPVTILPGDKLTTECIYDSTWRNGSSVLSGFATTDEMCMAFLVINKPVSYLFCSSEYPTQRTLNKYGIQNMTWDVTSAERVINDAYNPLLVGMRLSQLIENQTWTPTTIRQLEEEQRFGVHTANCPNTRVVGTLAYYALQLTRVSGGLIQIPLIQDSVPTTRTIESPFPGLLPVTYPKLIPSYVPPQTCPSIQDTPSNATTSGISPTSVAEASLDVTSTIAPNFKVDNISITPASPSISYSSDNLAAPSAASSALKRFPSSSAHTPVWGFVVKSTSARSTNRFVNPRRRRLSFVT